MLGGTLHLVTAYGSESRRDSALSEEFKYLSTETEGQTLIEDLAAGARALGVDPVLHLSKGDPAEVIIGVADKVNADLIVVGNAGMKGVRRILGSVPNTVAHGATAPWPSSTRSEDHEPLAPRAPGRGAARRPCAR